MASLSTLRQKWRNRASARKRQLKLFRKTGEAGHRKAAGRHGRALHKLAALIERAKKVVYSTRPGFPYWGGSAYIVRHEVRPRVPYPVTSTKRWETYGNPSSDHYRGNKLAYAEDYGAGTNYPVAQKVRSALDGGTHVDYENFYIERRGHTYRCQIIAANHGTGPHLHVGVERVS